MTLRAGRCGTSRCAPRERQRPCLLTALLSLWRRCDATSLRSTVQKGTRPVPQLCGPRLPTCCGFLLCVICARYSRAEKQLAADDVTLLVSLVGRRPVTGLALAVQLQTLVVTCLTAALRQPSLQSWVEPSVCVERLGALLRWVEPLPRPLHANDAKVAELLSLLRLSRTKELSR